MTVAKSENFSLEMALVDAQAFAEYGKLFQKSLNVVINAIPIWASTRQNQTSGFQTKRDSNQPA